jgi:hypothetical protein
VVTELDSDDEEPVSPDDDDEAHAALNLKALRWEEYKLLQAKLDRLAEFRFRVKSWSITLIAAIALGSSAYQVPWWLELGAGVAVTVAFVMMETFYNWTQNVFSARLKRLEMKLARGFLPADATARARRAARPGLAAVTPSISAAIFEAKKLQSKKQRYRAYLGQHPSIAFYGLLLILVVVLSVWRGLQGSASTTAAPANAPTATPQVSP